MKSGRLVHVIAIQHPTHGVNDKGTPETTWTTVATLRAELVEQSADELMRGPGDTTVEAVVFRTRYLASVEDEHRVFFDGQAYDITRIVTIGRRLGLELFCTRVEP